MKAVLKPDHERVAEDGKLTVYSKKLERQRKKQQQKRGKPLVNGRSIVHMPFDVLIIIFEYMRPSDIFRLARSCRTMWDSVDEHEGRIAKKIISWRYPCLEKCMRLPILLQNVDESLHATLQSPERQNKMGIHKRPFQHIKPFDPTLVCTCLTCVLRWNVLNLAVDFAHWQGNLDKGEPIPTIDRGRSPKWNRDLVERHGAIVKKALSSPLLHACILEAHLKSTVNSIRRHAENKGNKRRRFHMSEEDMASGTDDFLQRSGPPSVDFPFHRDNYYMLEAYLPNRAWIKERGSWAYVPANQHDTDLGYLKDWSWNKTLEQKKEEKSAARNDAL